MHLLHLDSASSGERSFSRAITAAFAHAWPGTITYRDLHAQPLPHLPDASLHWPPADRPEGSHPPAVAEALQSELVAELLAADVVLVGAPLYNYSVASTLKAWIDYIHIPGITAGPVQPMAGRTAVLVSSRGALYDAGTPTENWDHGVPVLELILGASLGMATEVIRTDVTLAEQVPALAPLSERSRAEFAAALATAAASAVRLGS